MIILADGPERASGSPSCSAAVPEEASSEDESAPIRVPSSGAVNPALTIMANALRVGDHLLERLGTAAVREAAEAPVTVDMR